MVTSTARTNRILNGKFSEQERRSLLKLREDIFRETGFIEVSDTSYTLESDYRVFKATASVPQTFTVPLDADNELFPLGTVVYVVQGGANEVTIEGAGGVTIARDTANFDNETRAANAVAQLVKVGDSTWHLSGDLTAVVGV